jgi:hypothetical protein
MLNRLSILLLLLQCSFVNAQTEKNEPPKQTNLMKVDSSTIGRDKSRVEFIGLEASESGVLRMSILLASLQHTIHQQHPWQ